jgi:Fe-Mn family superoxide dismutase
MHLLSRRELLKTAALGATALILPPSLRAAEGAGDLFTLPKLPYAFDALEPHIDARTMEIHHNRHHQAYIDNLKKALMGQDALAKKSLIELVRGVDDVPMAIRQAVINNGGGHYNHSIFWHMMAPKAGGEPSGELAKAIDTAFGSFAKFQDAFTQAAMTRFGSGWAWLVMGKEKLEVTSTANQDSPLMKGVTPLLGLDVWEHAYYLKYQNKRADYVKAFWNVVNWKDVAERYVPTKK